MKRLDTQKDITAQPEQFFPTGQTEWPASPTSSLSQDSHGFETEPLSPEAMPPSEVLWEDLSPKARDEFAESIATADWPQAAPAARLFAPILCEVAIMRRLRPDSLAVVLRPDPQTEIFLRLTAHRGLIEVSAQCERGDFEVLNLLWPQLQARLRLQGVKLLDLSQWVLPAPDGGAAFTGFFNLAQSVAEGLSYDLDPAASPSAPSPVHSAALQPTDSL
jgi:hypothetical protein